MMKLIQVNLNLLVILAMLSVARSAHAQDDPFADPFGAPPASAIERSPLDPLDTPVASTPDKTDATTTSPGLMTAELHAVALAYRQSPPKTPREFASALVFLARVRQWDEVAFYLDQLEKLNLTELQCAEMVQEVGLGSWLALQTTALPELDSNRNKILRSILDRSSQPTRSREVLSQHIQRLRHTDLGQRQRGIRGLQSAGSEGLRFLLQSVMQDSREPNRSMSAAWHSFGKQGQDAARAALWSSDSKTRQRLMELITPAPGREMFAEMLVCLHSSIDSDATRSLVLQALQRENVSTPSAPSVLQYLATKLEYQVNEIKKSRSIDFPLEKELWRLDDQQQLQVDYVSQDRVDLERAGQVAQGMLRIAEQAGFDSAVAFAVLLEHQSSHRRSRVENATTDAARTQVESPLGNLEKQLPDWVAESPEMMAQVWDAAVLHQLPAAQFRVVQQMGRMTEAQESSRTAILHRLVQSVRSGYPIVRFAAAEALLPRIPDQSFAGSHRAAEALVEISNLQAEPLVLVIGSDQSLREHAVNLLGQLGYRVEKVASARGAIRWLEQPRCVELIVVADRTADMPLGELVQRMRAQHRASKLPIAILAQDLTAGEELLMREDPGLVRSALTMEVVGMLEVINDCEKRTPYPQIDAADRVLWKTKADDFLSKVQATTISGAHFLNRWSDQTVGVKKN